MLPRFDIETIPWIGTMRREEPAVPWCMPEIRRKDVGPQRYSSGSYQPTYAGEPDYGTLPTAAAIEFLKHQYEGDRLAPRAPARYT